MIGSDSQLRIFGILPDTGDIVLTPIGGPLQVYFRAPFLSPIPFTSFFSVGNCLLDERLFRHNGKIYHWKSEQKLKQKCKPHLTPQTDIFVKT